MNQYDADGYSMQLMLGIFRLERLDVLQLMPHILYS